MIRGKSNPRPVGRPDAGDVAPLPARLYHGRVGQLRLTGPVSVHYPDLPVGVAIKAPKEDAASVRRPDRPLPGGVQIARIGAVRINHPGRFTGFVAGITAEGDPAIRSPIGKESARLLGPQRPSWRSAVPSAFTMKIPSAPMPAGSGP